MAAPTTTTILATFHAKICCKQALVISDNNDIAICTEDGCYILEYRYGTDLTDTLHHFTKFYIPCSKYVNIVDHSLTVDKAETFADDEMHEAALDRTILPATQGQTSYKGFSAVSWSSKHTGLYQRCILACLSFDHRLSLFYSPVREEWEELVELSQVYYDYCAKHETNTLLETFSEVKEYAYKTAAVGLAWSQAIRVTPSAEEFSLLAVSMKNGDIVLWKAKHPVTCEDSLSLYCVVSTESLFPSALSWCPQDKQTGASLYLAVGYQSGAIKIIIINVGNPTDPKIFHKSIGGSPDFMPVSTLCWKTLSETHHVLLSTKENFIVGHILLVNNTGDIKVIKTNHCKGPHILPANSLRSVSDQIVLTSIDGMSNHVKLKVTNDSLSIACEPLNTFKHKYNMKWKAHGGVMTQNGFYYVCGFSPAAFYDHLKHKFPLAIHIVSLKDISPVELPSLVANGDINLGDCSDILDSVRENLQSDILAPEKILKEYKKSATNFENLAVGVLQAWRYMLMVVLTMLQEKKCEELEESLPVERRAIEVAIEKLTRQILEKHCRKSLENLATCTDVDSKNKQMANMMQKWLKANKSDKNSSDSEDIEVDPRLDRCVICDERYKILTLSVKCGNGHRFGLCCKTMLPCVQAPFTTCLTCGVTALSVSTLKDFHVLDDTIHCSLCCTSLF